MNNSRTIYKQMISKYEKCYDVGKYYVIPSSLKMFYSSPYLDFDPMPDGYEYYSNESLYTIEEIKNKLLDIA